MKNIFLFALAVLGIAPCSAVETGEYVVSGTLPNSRMDGDMVYISRYDDDKVIDSARVDGKAFRFSGRVDTAAFCRVDIKGRRPTYFILEPGNIMVNTDEDKFCQPSGTPLNDEMAQLAAEEEGGNAKLRRTVASLRSKGQEQAELNKQAAALTDKHAGVSEEARRRAFRRPRQ